MNFLRAAYNWPYRGWGVVVFGLLLVLAVVLFYRASKEYAEEKDKGGLALQFAFTAPRFKAIVRGWVDKAVDGQPSGTAENPHAIQAYRRQLIQLDMLFPVIYACLLAFFYAWKRSEPPTTSDLIFFALPFVAALLDWTENCLHLYLLRGVNSNADINSTQFSSVLVFISSLVSTTKYAITTAVFIAAFR